MEGGKVGEGGRGKREGRKGTHPDFYQD